MMYCFKCGLYKQGLLHDLSKYSYSEFLPSVKYFTGYCSPITKEKKLNGYSKCWLHHKGRNKHHWEYWVDRLDGKTELETIDMPFNYLLESVLDKISASKIYNKDNYNDSLAYDFFKKSNEYQAMNKETSRKLEILLAYLKDNGEQAALEYYKQLYKDYKKNKIINL